MINWLKSPGWYNRTQFLSSHNKNYKCCSLWWLQRIACVCRVCNHHWSRIFPSINPRHLCWRFNRTLRNVMRHFSYRNRCCKNIFHYKTKVWIVHRSTLFDYSVLFIDDLRKNNFCHSLSTCCNYQLLKYSHILCLWFRASLNNINNCPTRCNTKQSIYYSASTLYTFRMSTTAIIRNAQNCNYSLRYWSTCPS